MSEPQITDVEAQRDERLMMEALQGWVAAEAAGMKSLVRDYLDYRKAEFERQITECLVAFIRSKRPLAVGAQEDL